MYLHFKYVWLYSLEAIELDPETTNVDQDISNVDQMAKIDFDK